MMLGDRTEANNDDEYVPVTTDVLFERFKKLDGRLSNVVVQLSYTAHWAFISGRVTLNNYPEKRGELGSVAMETLARHPELALAKCADDRHKARSEQGSTASDGVFLFDSNPFYITKETDAKVTHALDLGVLDGCPVIQFVDRSDNAAKANYIKLAACIEDFRIYQRALNRMRQVLLFYGSEVAATVIKKAIYDLLERAAERLKDAEEILNAVHASNEKVYRRVKAERARYSAHRLATYIFKPFTNYFEGYYIEQDTFIDNYETFAEMQISPNFPNFLPPATLFIAEVKKDIEDYDISLAKDMPSIKLFIKAVDELERAYNLQKSTAIPQASKAIQKVATNTMPPNCETIVPQLEENGPTCELVPHSKEQPDYLPCDMADQCTSEAIANTPQSEEVLKSSATRLRPFFVEWAAPLMAALEGWGLWPNEGPGHALELYQGPKATVPPVAPSEQGQLCFASVQLDWGGEYVSPMLVCPNTQSTIYVFPKEGASLFDTCTQDRCVYLYDINSCRPVEFEGQAAVFCEGETTTKIEVPSAQSSYNVDGNIMLGMVFMYWGQQFYHWFNQGKKKETPKQVAAENVKARLRALQEKLLAIKKSAQALNMYGDNSANFSLAEYKEALNKLCNHQKKFNYIEEGMLAEMEGDIAYFKKEVVLDLEWPQKNATSSIQGRSQAVPKTPKKVVTHQGWFSMFRPSRFQLPPPAIKNTTNVPVLVIK